MKMKNLCLVSLTLSAILIIVGCQPEQSKPTGQTINPSGELEKESVDSTVPQSQESVKTTVKTASTEGTPKIVLKKSTHDFGEVGPSSIQKADYEFTNKGDGPLVVNNVQTTCGCSKPTLIKGETRYPIPLNEPVSFEPGESGRVEVTYTAGSAKASVTKHLYIITNDPDTPRAELELKADITVKVSVKPETVELRLDQDNAGMPELTVQSDDGKAFSIKSIAIANNTITVPFDSKEKATKFILKPKVDMEKLTQFNTGVIQIATDHPQGGTLMVRYNAKPMYEVSNPRYILQNVEPGQPILRENLIRSNYGDKAEIESATSLNGYMEIESQEQDGNHIKLMIKITPPAQDSPTRRYITDELKIVLKDGHELIIRCSGWFRLN